MSITSQLLASGPGWRVFDVICTHGPHSRPFEEQRAEYSIAAVTAGTFRYRTRSGAATLVPGSVLLGEAGACYECGHTHSRGDRCLAFHFTPRLWEADGGQARPFNAPALPPLPQMTPVLTAAEAARDDGDQAAFEELALRLAGAITGVLGDVRKSARRATARDEKRIAAAVRRIERDAAQPLSLAALAREAAMSRYHFLRTFSQVIGLTPHQFVLRTRLHRAALQLRRSDEVIAAIAYDCGFNDLSTFNRRFRRVMGVSPADYRLRA